MQGLNRFSLLVAIGGILLPGLVVAGVPSKPREFTAKGQYTNTPNVYQALLQWAASQSENANDSPTGYYIYRATGQTEDMSQFSRIATVPSDTQRTYVYIDSPLSAGTYTYFLTAYNNDGESQRTPIRVVVVPPNTPPDNVLRFVTVPPPQGRVGVQYRYQARAETSLQGVTIRYQLLQGPDGMSIDEESGLVTWVPQRPGRYEVSIKAIVQYQGQAISVRQGWTIVVEGEENEEGCIVVEGVVQDSNGTRMTDGVVYAYRSVARENRIIWIVAARAELNQHGVFRMRLPAGQYKFFTEGRSHLPSWYERSRNADNATVLTFECGSDSTRELVFIVSPRSAEQFYVVSGRVTSQQTGAGVSAWVKFSAFINYHRDDDYRDEWGGTVTFTAETNADGYFEIRLSNRYTYIARAIPRSEDYLALYYDGTTNIAEAKRITLTGNLDGINFALPLRPPFHGGFSGQIVDSSGRGIAGWAVACRLVAQDSDRREHIRRFRTVETDSMGHYQFVGLEPGVYVVLGIPRSRDYVPGFCVLGEMAALRWRNATRIGVGEVMLTVQYDIKLRARSGERGMVRLEGWIRGRTGQMKNSMREQGDVPVAGALIAVITSSGIAGYAVSQDDGYYAITELIPLTGQLVVDHPDYESTIVPLTLGVAAGTQSQDLTVEPVILNVEEKSIPNLRLVPNPASTYLQLELGHMVGTVKIELTTLLGTTVAVYQTDTPTISIATDQLASGIYLVRIISSAGVQTVPVAIMH